MSRERSGRARRGRGGDGQHLRYAAVDESAESILGRRIEPQPNGCWLFQGTPDQYGRCWIPALRRQVIVHRFVYETLVGPIPSGYHLHHHCETPGCCNPGHVTPLHPRQHKAEHTLTRMEQATEEWKRDPVKVLQYAKALRRRRD